MLYHDHAQSLYVEHKLPKCTSCSGTLACSAKTPKQIYLSTAGKGLRVSINRQYILSMVKLIPSGCANDPVDALIRI